MWFLSHSGHFVNDLHTVDKSKLWALNFSATQELDRKVQDLEKTVEILIIGPHV